jgi:hypothetical protein
MKVALPVKAFLLFSSLLPFQFLRSQTVDLSSSNLPIIVINTPNKVEIPNEPKITADMGIIFNGEGVVNKISDPFNHYKGKIGIEVRGQSSQGFPMKSYSVELRDLAGNDLDQSLFGLPAESDWVMYAPFTDKTLMRNFLAYNMSRAMGRWAPRCRHVEVIINGDYKGVYIFMERIKRGPDRVNISNLRTIDISGDQLTGGYIFSLDKGANGWFSTYGPPNATNSNKRQFSYVYPELIDIVPQQKAYIKSAVDAFESALAAPKFQDPFIGVRKFADVASFIDFFIVNEVSRNVDGYRLSSYFYKDKDSKNPRIYAGPVWDFDLAFRNADYCSGSLISGWAYMFNYVCPGDGAGLIPFWWERFMGADTAFQADFRCRWKNLQKTILNPEYFNTVIDSIATVVQEAQVRHFTRWPILGKYVWPNPQPIAVTYAQELTYLKAWLRDRMQWITNSLPNTGVCYDFPTDYSGSMIVNLFSNPIQGEGKMEVKSRYRQEVEVTVLDMLGRNMGTRRSTVNPGVSVVSLQSANWRPGIYFVRIVSTTGDKFTFRVVK